MGDRQASIVAGRRALELLPIETDAVDAPRLVWVLALVYLRAGEHEAAIDQLEAALAVPSEVTREWLRIDPRMQPLRSIPRFERLLAAEP